MHLCPGLISATEFTKLTIFRDGLAKTAKFEEFTKGKQRVYIRGGFGLS